MAKAESKKIESNSVHVEVLDEEAVYSKKTLLELQLHLLNTLRNMISYKDLREDEFKIRGEARDKMQEVYRLVKEIISSMPILGQYDKSSKGYSLAPEPKRTFAQGSQVQTRNAVKKARLDEELEQIKRRLESIQ